MRKAVILLCLAAAALAAPAEHAPPAPAHAPAPAPPAHPVPNPHVAHALQVPHHDAAKKSSATSHLEPLEAKAAADDLKPDASFWSFYGWGYEPLYYNTYSYYTPRVYYTAPSYYYW